MTDDERNGGGTPGDAESESPNSNAADRVTVSIRLEGEYDNVMSRLDRSTINADSHCRLGDIVDNLEETLTVIEETGGGLRSDVYEATDFTLDDPWELRKYLEILEMHDLIHLDDDRWVPHQPFTAEPEASDE